MYILFCFFFFFSSRRRHTRWPRDWSSDVCSSDLKLQNAVLERVTKDDRPIASGFSVHLCRCSRCRTQQEQQRKKKADFLEIRSEEHTSELQSRGHLVCRLLLEKKKDQLVSSLLTR